MSFKSEAVTNEVYMKIERQTKFSDSVRITPLQTSKDFPIDTLTDGHCVLSSRCSSTYKFCRF